VKITGQCKDKQSLAQDIRIEEVENDKGDNAIPNSKSSVLIGYNHQLHSRVLLYLVGWKKIRLISPLCFVD